MGFKCSLLGHDFADPETEREREERGDEVVTTIREVAHCTRCEETTVVSESKEVTAIVEPERADEPPEGTDRVGEDAYDEPGGTPQGDTEEPLADDTLAPPDEATAEAIESLADRDPAEEDAEILEDDEGPRERAPGQWPDDDEPWEPSGTTESAPDAEPAAEAEPTVAEAAAAGSESAPTDGGDDGLLIPEGSYVCPACGFTTTVDGSSLRAGDACPECQRDYLEGERNS